MDTFGEWIRQQRSLRGLTRKEFAKRVGCSISALQKIENGERRPSVQIAQLIANCLDVPLQGRSIFVRVARGELSVDRLPSEPKTAAPRDPSRPKTNLPVFAAPLIGRQREVEQLTELLLDPQCRLLTLVGPGGIGKTRLATEAASKMPELFPDGVYFVPLTSANSTRFIVPVIADAIGFAFHASDHADPEAQLFSYLREKRTLLLMDNLEQLLAEPGIELLSELLAHAPQVKLLATSREALGLHHEWLFEVSGLHVPEGIHPEGNGQNTSVELFLQRARRADVQFNASPEDYAPIVRICRLVGGNPLGIELAGAWVRTLSCAEIAREIERGLGILAVSARDVPARHRSMRAVFDYSWKLLSEEEQQALLRLSVFHGGFRRDAAGSVADASLPVLSSLVTKSLIRRSGAGRYDLHELIQQFAAERLAGSPEEQSAIQACHGSYYLVCFGEADGRLRSSAQRETLAELIPEMGNFRAAWDWALSRDNFALIEQTLRTFFRLYDTRGWYQEGLDTLDRAVNALETAHGHSPPERAHRLALGHLLATRAWFAYRVADYARAQSMLERSLTILRPLDEPLVLLISIIYLGRVMEMTGSYSRASELYSEGLELATAVGDRWFRAVCFTLHTALLGITQSLVEPAVTHERLQSAVADWRLIGDPRLIGLGLDFLSRSALRLGRFDEARRALEETVALNESIGFAWGLGTAYRGLGKIAQAQEDHQHAVEMFRRSLNTFTELGGSWFAARVLAEMGGSLLALGDEAEAGRAWRRALRDAMEIRGIPVALDALAGLAGLQVRQGEAERALELVEMVLNHPASLEATRKRAGALQAGLEAQFSPAHIDRIRASIREKTLEAVVKDLLR